MLSMRYQDLHKTAGVVAIEYYWMADVLKKLMLIDEFQITDYLSEDQISDLAYIQYRLGAHYNTPSAVRLVDIFVELIYNICNGARRLEIQIEDISTLDPVSFSALEILKKKCGSQLIVK